MSSWKRFWTTPLPDGELRARLISVAALVLASVGCQLADQGLLAQYFAAMVVVMSALTTLRLVLVRRAERGERRDAH